MTAPEPEAPAGEPLVMPPDEFEAVKAVARTFGAVATKPCGCGPDEPCVPHADTSPPVAAALDPLAVTLDGGLWTAEAQRELEDRFRKAMTNPWRARAEAAERKLAAITEHCRQRRDAAIVQGPVSHLCRDIEAIIGTEAEAGHA